jgi:hypothetical protein
VLLLDEVLAPDTLADEGEVGSALLQNALSLAQQRAGQLRLVIVLLPDIDLAVQQQQQQSARVPSTGGMSVGFGGGGGGSMSITTSASEGCSGGAAAATVGLGVTATGTGAGTGSYMPGSGMTGDDAGFAAAQQQQQRLKRIPRTLVRTLREQLEQANEQSTILAGTMRQVLQLLEAMVGRLQPGSTAVMH